MRTRTELTVTRGAQRAVVRSRAGVLVPRIVHRTARTATVALVQAGALLLGGDEVELVVRVGEGCALELSEIGGTVAYPGAPARWDVIVEVAPNARLSWAGLPFVVSDGAEVRRTVRACVAAGARLLLRETLVLGRSGEHGGSIRGLGRFELDGGPALVEDLQLQGGIPQPGVLGAHRVLDSVLLLGERRDEAGAAVHAGGGTAVHALHAEGSLARWIGDDTHRSTLSSVFERWNAPLDTPLREAS